jgi:ArsR family transcriptional regulator, virulence genes transcriptional regulator
MPLASASRPCREDNLVQTRRESQTIFYSLASKEAGEVIALLYNLFCAPGCKDEKG